MRMELCPYCGEREQVRGLPPHEGSLHERIRALEAELAEWKDAALSKDDLLDRVQDYPQILAERDALKARVADLERLQTKCLLQHQGGGRESGANPLQTARVVIDEGTRPAANPAARLHTIVHDDGEICDDEEGGG